VMLTARWAISASATAVGKAPGELLRSGRWLQLWQEARALVAGKMRWRGWALQAFGPVDSGGRFGVWAQRRLARRRPRYHTL